MKYLSKIFMLELGKNMQVLYEVYEFSLSKFLVIGLSIKFTNIKSS